MDKQEVLMIESLLHEIIKEGEGVPNEICVNDAKRQGVLAGAKEGLAFLSKLKDGNSQESAFFSLNSRINQSIYSLFVAEYEHERKGSNMLEYEIAYWDTLINALQLLRNRFSELVKEM